jgi:hypothetical protein
MAWRNDVCQWRKSSENVEKFPRFSIANISANNRLKKKKTGRDVSGRGKNLSS